MMRFDIIIADQVGNDGMVQLRLMVIVRINREDVVMAAKLGPGGTQEAVVTEEQHQIEREQINRGRLPSLLVLAQVRQAYLAKIACFPEQEAGERKVAGRDKNRRARIAGKNCPDRRRGQYEVAKMVGFDDGDLHIS